MRCSLKVAQVLNLCQMGDFKYAFKHLKHVESERLIGKEKLKIDG